MVHPRLASTSGIFVSMLHVVTLDKEMATREVRNRRR